MGECLLECLKEAHLERYYPNFLQRGLRNCQSLVGLSMPDYPKYGVVSMEDRLHLFKLIQIIKSVQGEGVTCRHKNNHEPTVANSAHNHAHTSTLFHGAANGNGAIVNNSRPVHDYRPKEVIVKHMPFASNGLFNPAATTTQYKPSLIIEAPKKPHNLQGRPLFREKPLFQWDKPAKKSPEVVFRNGSDSPVFKCRKTLQFTDSDLEDSDDDMPATRPMVASSQMPVIRTNPVPTVVHKVPKDKPREQTLPEDPVSQPGVSATMTDGTAPRAFFVDVHTPNKGQNTSRDSGQSVMSNRSQANHLRHVPIIRSKEPPVEHAYFPHPEGPMESKPIFVEKVFHSNGYNYGVPTTPHGSAKKNDQMDLSKINVFVRKRPLTVREVKRKETDVVKAKDPCTVVVDESKLAVDLTAFVQQHIFHFDHVFDNSCTNEDVYETSVKPLVKCVFSRGTATCFAFGQTGAGKTYTLLGSKTVPGMYRLAGSDMFEGIKQNRSSSRRLSLWISYFEIYCGQLYDLLNKRKRLHVRENGKQKVCITGLTETQARDVKSLVEIIQYGNLARSTGSTGVNAHSSRSHAVLQLEIRDQKDSKIGRLSFIDLAGSERASDVTDTDRQTRFEGAEINQSLLALKECIRSIDQENKHTPYRQSKLTHILRESFTGNSQTVMIANIAPSQSCCENTLNTLRYADRVKELKKDVKVVGKNTPPQSKVNVNANNKTPKRTPPSLFHPSKIMFSSTPKVRTSPETRDGDLSRALQNADESPIGGHQLHMVGAPLKVGRRGSDCGSDGSYSERMDCSDLNNNKNIKSSSLGEEKVVNGDELGHVTGEETKSKMTLDKVISNMKTVVGHSAVIKKETLSQSDIAKYIISNRNLHQPDAERRRSKSMDSVRICPEDNVHEEEEGRPSAQSVMQLPGSAHSRSSDEALIQGHREIMSHLDQVLDKARSAMLNISPGQTSEPRSAKLKISPGQTSEPRSVQDTSSPPDQVQHQSRFRFTNKTDKVKRNLFDDLDSDADNHSATRSRQMSNHNEGRNSYQEVISGTGWEEPMFQTTTSRDNSLGNHGDSCSNHGDDAALTTSNVPVTGRTHKFVDNNVKHISASVSKTSHIKETEINNVQNANAKRLPASTSKLEDLRKQSAQVWSRGDPKKEGTHLYYHHNLEPKLLFQQEVSDPASGTLGLSGINCLDGTNSAMNRGWSEDLILDIHSDIGMPLSARDDRKCQRPDVALPLSARENHSYKPATIRYEVTPTSTSEGRNIATVHSADKNSLDTNTMQHNWQQTVYQEQHYGVGSYNETEPDGIVVDIQAVQRNATDDKFVRTVTENVVDTKLQEEIKTERSMKSADKSHDRGELVGKTGEWTKEVDSQSRGADVTRHESLGDSTESRSWAALLSTHSNESRSLQSSHDSGISSGAHSVGIHKSSATAVDEHMNNSTSIRSCVSLHKNSAFCAVEASEGISNSRSHSIESQSTCHSSETSNNISTSSGGILFMPIEPCPTTPREKYQITVPSVVAKTVIPESGSRDRAGANKQARPVDGASNTHRHTADCDRPSNYGHSHEPISNRNGHEPISNRNGHEPISNRNGHEPISNHNGHEPISNRNGHETISNHNGHEPISNHNGHEPISNRNGHEPISNRNGHEPISNHNGHEPISNHNGHEMISNPSRAVSQSPVIRVVPEQSAHVTIPSLTGTGPSSETLTRPTGVPPINIKGLQQDISQSSDSPNTTQTDHTEAQNELIGLHEEQLSEVIAFCKEEMRLLINVKSGTIVFEDYLSLLRDIQFRKTHSVSDLLAQIHKYSSQFPNSKLK